MLSTNETNLIHQTYYQWRRKRWRISPRRLKPRRLDSFRTSFLLGVQGGGLSLVSRCLRRSQQVISATGNHRYWSGADEMHTVLGSAMPPEFAGIRHHAPLPNHPHFRPPRSWTYACDELLPHYRRASTSDVPIRQVERFKRLTAILATVNGSRLKAPTFLDKSQVFTVKAGLIQDALRDTDPRFAMVTMNPYAACGKAAAGWAADLRQASSTLPQRELIRTAAQHWSNSLQAAREDLDSSLLTLRFEDFLQKPRENLDAICRHLGIPFDGDLLPQEHHRLPFGTRFKDRWHPLQVGRGDEHVQRFAEWAGEEGMSAITDICGDIMKEVGYKEQYIDS